MAEVLCVARKSTLLAMSVGALACASAPPPVAPEPSPEAPATATSLPTVEPPSTPVDAAPTDAAEEEPELVVTDSGLGIVDVKLGEGAEAVAGAEVAVHYEGRLEDGRVFDASRERGVPFRFELGDEMVIPGWEEGVLGMKVGGKRRLIVPPHLAYGDRGQGVIPGGAILEFEIELLEVEPPPEP